MIKSRCHPFSEHIAYYIDEFFREADANIASLLPLFDTIKTLICNNVYRFLPPQTPVSKHTAMKVDTQKRSN